MPLIKVPHSVNCKGCDLELDTKNELEGAPNAPCPACGSTLRVHNIHRIDLCALSAEMSFDLRGKSAENHKSGPGQPLRPKREYRFKDAPSADGQRRKVHRTFDREADIYEEIIVEEPGGDVVRHLREPLSCHRDRGTAKKRTYRDALSWALATIALEDIG